MNESTEIAETDALMTVEEVATYLKVDKTWVYRAVQHDTLPSYKVGKYLRFRKADVDALIKERA